MSDAIYPYDYPLALAYMKCEERYPQFRELKFQALKKIRFAIDLDTYILCYAYFRWFDNIVDSYKLLGGDIANVVDRQKRFLEQLYNKENPEEISTEELFLAHLVNYDLKFSKGMRKSLETLMSTFEFDAKRRHKIVRKYELEEYIKNNTQPYIDLSLSILNFQISDKHKNKLYEIASAGFIVDYIWSLRTDINLGHINISEEEVKQFGIDVSNLDSDVAKAWTKSKLQDINNVFSQKDYLIGLPIIGKVIAWKMLYHRREKIEKLILNDYKVN